MLPPPRSLVLLSALSVLATSAARPVFAQATRPGRAAVTGTVFDSLVANAPFAGAEVTVDGTDLSATADARGRFRIDGVPAGRAVMRFYHARLDSLGFAAPPGAIVVGDSGTFTVELATPSPATIHTHLCPAPQPPSTGLLLGRVRDVDTRGPVPDADVTVRWSEWTVGTGALTRNERTVASRTDDAGAYRLCGVPTDVAVVARATGSGHVTGLVEVDLSTRLFDVRDFAISMKDSGATVHRLALLDSLIRVGDSIPAVGSTSLTGAVRGPDQKPIPDAQVALFGFPVSVRTNSDGIYRLTGVPAGSQTLEVRAVGFAPQRLTVELATGQRRTLDVAAIRSAQTLASVNIVGQGSHFDVTGFESRRKTGIGHFIGPEEIERRHVFDTSQLLWGVTGSRVVWDGSDNVVMFTRPSGSGVGGGAFNDLCNPAIFIDGFAAYDMNDVRPYDVRAIEIYTDRGAAPAMYRASSLKDSGRPDRHCAVILVWTKPRPQKRAPKPGR
jgi:hypothetical protein